MKIRSLFENLESNASLHKDIFIEYENASKHLRYLESRKKMLWEVEEAIINSRCIPDIINTYPLQIITNNEGYINYAIMGTCAKEEHKILLDELRLKYNYCISLLKTLDNT